MGTEGGRDIWEIEKERRGVRKIFGNNSRLGQWWERELGNLKGKRGEEQRTLRNMRLVVVHYIKVWWLGMESEPEPTKGFGELCSAKPGNRSPALDLDRGFSEWEI